LNATNSNFDTLMGLYTGTNVADLTEVASNDDADAEAGIFGSWLAQAVVSNETYHIAVDGYAGATGVVELAYSLAPSPVFEVTVAESVGGTVQPGSGIYASNVVATFTATPEPGYLFSGWSGLVSSSDNPVTFDVTASGTLTAQFVQDQYADDFENGFNSDLDWDVTGGAGNVPWFVQSTNASGGLSAARSGVIGNLQTSALKLTFVGEAGMASFDVQVSSESSWDFLRFLVNGALNAQWSGEVGWMTYQVPVNAGTNVFEWRYVKDAAGKAGMDAAFIDNLKLPFAETVLVLTNASVGAFDILFSGPPNQTFQIQASTNMIQWTSISTNQATSGLMHFVDPDAGQNVARYYRALVPSP
jgi:hypothetical protein